MTPETLFNIAAFAYGLCIGSFLNVCIHRLPAAMSIVRPRSRCPVCGQSIRWYDNIPVLSWLWLRRKCRDCATPIPWRYPLVELLSGVFAVITIARFGPGPASLVYFCFIAALLVITFIDLDHQIIPNAITLPGIPLCFLGALVVPAMTWQDALMGLAVGGGGLYLVGWAYYLLKGKEGMGGGDIKLLAMIGALTGLRGVVFTLFVASATGTVAGLVQMAAARLVDMERRIPFGPFLAFGAVIYLFYGRELILWYLRLLS
ncbi:MAG: prepilin peptidase [Desulfobacterales bacterium]|nr:prepilin peptidase [Desulfobacterales bacterium]